MTPGCLNCGHPKWTHYRLFLGCVKKGCGCDRFTTKPYKPYERKPR